MGRGKYKILGLNWADKRKMAVDQFIEVFGDDTSSPLACNTLHTMAIGEACRHVDITAQPVKLASYIIPSLFEIEKTFGVGSITEKRVRTLTGVFEHARVSEIANLERHGLLARMGTPAKYKPIHYQLTQTALKLHHLHRSIYGNLLADINMRLSTTKR